MIERKEGQPVSPRSGFFYGYIVVIASFFIMLMTFGSRNVFGVFFKPMANEFGWNAAATSSAFSFSSLLEGFAGIVTGRLTDRFGPRAVLIFCGFLLGIGYLLTSRITALWQMYLFYGVIIGIGMSGVFVPLVSTIARWFISRRSAMTGIVLTGISVGMLIGSPLANWVIYTYDWRTSYTAFGIAIMVVVILAALFLKRDPAQIGQEAYYRNSAAVPRSELHTRDFSLTEAARTRQFWLALTIFFCIGFCSLVITVHLVPYTIETGIPATTAANAMAAMAGFSITGRLIMGTLADKISNKRAFIISFVVCSTSFIWLIFTTETWEIFLFAAVFGFAQGGLAVLQSPTTSELFGLKSSGAILGFCGLLATLGGGSGPLLAGYIFDVTGKYQMAFVVGLMVCIVGLVCTSVLKPVKGNLNQS